MIARSFELQRAMEIVDRIMCSQRKDRWKDKNISQYKKKTNILNEWWVSEVVFFSSAMWPLI